MSVDLADFVAPLLTEALHAPQVATDFASLIASDDVLHPAGPALHVWQCIWVI